MKIKKSELKEIENAKTFYGKHVAPFWEQNGLQSDNVMYGYVGD